jgi:molecular chaperone HtpG
MDGQLDVHQVGQIEQKLEKTHCSRVDSDTLENLIRKEEAAKVTLTDEQRNALEQVFKSQMSVAGKKTEFYVAFEALGANANPVMITQSEYMRRMREMSAMQPGMSFYGEMPESYNLVLNTEHPLIKKVLADEETACSEALAPVLADIKGWEARQQDLRDKQNKKKPEEITQEEKDDMSQTNQQLDELRGKRDKQLADYAAGDKLVHELIDLALLGNGMLKGEPLASFIRRSLQMIG